VSKSLIGVNDDAYIRFDVLILKVESVLPDIDANHRGEVKEGILNMIIVRED
jgi:hypothetical protein